MATIRNVVVFLLLSALVLACGPSIKIIPLRGEGPEVVALIGAEGDLSDETAVVLASKRFHRLLKQRQVATFWDLLTPQTRKALESLASQGSWNALEMLDSQRFTNPKDSEGPPIPVDVEALFFVRDPISFQRVGEPQPKEKMASIRVRNAAGDERLVQLRLIEDEWYLHHTDFQTLPVIPAKAVPLLPGKYTLKDAKPATTSSSDEASATTDEPKEKPTPEPDAPASPVNDDF